MGSTAYSETYTYNDSDGSLNTMTTGVGTTLTMGYDGLRRLTSVTGDPFNRSYAYRDISGTATTLQVSQLSYPNLGSGVSFGYTYDNLGNIATYTAPDGEVITYSYDNQGQLLKAEGDATYLYVYDSVGNILSANGHTYSYGNANWKDLLTAFDGNSITYDASGNPTSYYNGTRWTMTWANGRSLATASDGTTSLSFTYDASGLRTSKTVGSTTYRYYYAGGKLMRMTWGGNTIDFFYDESGLPYAMKHNGTVYYYVTNLQGDVMRVVNASGTVVASYDYDPYGKVLSATGTLANVNPLRYRAYVYDQETGFYYLQSRYYDPAIGRFLNADSYASTGQGIIGSNMLAYCSNNPINSCDTTGKLAVASYSIGTAIDFLLDVTINQLVRVTASAMNQLVEEAKIAYARTSKAIRSYAKACIDEYVELLKKSLPCVHHIVPPGEFSNRADRTQQHLQEMREILIDAGINPEKDWINQVSVSQGFHASLHTNLYIEYLYKDLKKASGDKDQVKLVLYWYRIMITAADPYSAGY